MLSLFFSKNLNHIGDLFENNGKMKKWDDLRAKLVLDNHKKILLGTNYSHIGKKYF